MINVELYLNCPLIVHHFSIGKAPIVWKEWVNKGSVLWGIYTVSMYLLSQQYGTILDIFKFDMHGKEFSG